LRIAAANFEPIEKTLELQEMGLCERLYL